MIAVDTNILLRILTDDDPEQAAIARALFDSNDIIVTIGVMMETEWVLRSAYRWSVSRIADALETLFLAPNTRIELPELVSWALSRFRGGADLADMLHLVASRDANAFASFERRLAQLAGPSAPVPVIRPGC
jgi:predicted nucleic-acid-binding protein